MAEKPEKDEAAATRIAGLMGEAVEAAAAGQALTLALLQAEMEAITQLMPGLAPAQPAETEAEAEARQRAEEARIETDFDNMPV
ncbi:MAG: hypothetical protein O9292_06830 [Rhodobacteraceae bacterium]|nr:hypothetical protein [Paracoccaceae bacterium]MCZ8152085.1 hypothetical protein [Paracoccaceae bacterium]